MKANIPIMLVTLFSIVCSTPLLAGKGNSPDQPDKWNPEWYMRLSVSAPSEELKDEGNVIGQLYDSVDGQDSHDLIELNPTFATYLTLVFVHDDWAQAGHYGSDYHDQDYKGSDQWEFIVRSDNSYRDITLYWSDVQVIERLTDVVDGEKDWQLATDAPIAQKLAKRMWLEDLYTGERVYAIEDGQRLSYEFNMLGSNTRHFRWVLESKNGKAPSKSVKTTTSTIHILPQQSAHSSELPRPREPGR